MLPSVKRPEATAIAISSTSQLLPSLGRETSSVAPSGTSSGTMNFSGGNVWVCKSAAENARSLQFFRGGDLPWPIEERLSDVGCGCEFSFTLATAASCHDGASQASRASCFQSFMDGPLEIREMRRPGSLAHHRCRPGLRHSRPPPNRARPFPYGVASGCSVVLAGVPSSVATPWREAIAVCRRGVCRFHRNALGRRLSARAISFHAGRWPSERSRAALSGTVSRPARQRSEPSERCGT